MLSKIIREKIQTKYGHSIRYPKDCHALADHISVICKSRISPSTLKRLYGFVKGASQEPRLYTLDMIGEYLGYKGWDQLITSLDKSDSEAATEIEKLNAGQLKKCQTLVLTYEPSKKIELQNTSEGFLVTSSNDRKILQGDKLHFRTVELHYPLVLINILRKQESLGKSSLATVSGITSIRKA